MLATRLRVMYTLDHCNPKSAYIQSCSKLDNNKYINGTYLRNGPGLWIGDHDFRHLFDGYSTLVKLEFDDGRIFSGHRLLESDAYKSAKKHKNLSYLEFSETPKPSRSNFKNPFSGVGEIVKLFSGDSLTDNANTGVILTQKGSILVDHYTLETIGKFKYDDRLCDRMIHSAHPIVTETEMWTLIPDLVKPGYRVVRMEAGSNKREVVARVKCRSGSWGPGWVHSFGVMENYVLIPEMPLRYSVRDLLRAEPTPFYKFEWCPNNYGAFAHVMSKHTGEISEIKGLLLERNLHILERLKVIDTRDCPGFRL
ncbi:hypothetical protein YC2023_007448 [Brassica napus]